MAVSTGIVGYDSASTFIQKHATNEELTLLGRSEHPILRTVALREMLSRTGFDHFGVIMNHLNDTATVAIDAGEWGIWFRTV